VKNCCECDRGIRVRMLCIISYGMLISFLRRFLKSCHVRVKDLVNFAETCKQGSGSKLDEYRKKDLSVHIEGNAKQGEGRENSVMTCDADETDDQTKNDENDGDAAARPAKRLRLEPSSLSTNTQHSSIDWEQALQVLDDNCQLTYPYPITAVVQNASTKKVSMIPGMTRMYLCHMSDMMLI